MNGRGSGAVPSVTGTADCDTAESHSLLDTEATSAWAEGGGQDGPRVEAAFAEILREVLGAEAISVDGDFFDDLGADSMVMAHFCARVGKRADLRVPGVRAPAVAGVPPDGRAVRRRRHLRDVDGLRPLLPRAGAVGAGGRGGQRGLGDVRRCAGPADDPGLGTSVRPPILDESYVDDVVWVEEKDTIRACHRLARRGFLFGGSTGTVVSGAMTWLEMHHGYDLTAVAIAPDLGERYLDTVYQGSWLRDLYGEDVLAPDGVSAAPRTA